MNYLLELTKVRNFLQYTNNLYSIHGGININIGIDIDGVMNNLEDFYKSYGSKFCYEYNLPFQINDKEYKIRDMFRWNKIIENLFYDTYYDILLSGKQFLHPHVEEVICSLHKSHEIVIISARTEKKLPKCINKSMEETTKIWLKENNIVYDYLVFSEVNKMQEIIKYKIDVMIEDNPIFIMNAANAGMNLICFDASYNYHLRHKNIIHTYSWYNLLSIISNFELLKKEM